MSAIGDRRFTTGHAASGGVQLDRLTTRAGYPTLTCASVGTSPDTVPYREMEMSEHFGRAVPALRHSEEGTPLPVEYATLTLDYDSNHVLRWYPEMQQSLYAAEEWWKRMVGAERAIISGRAIVAVWNDGSVECIEYDVDPPRILKRSGEVELWDWPSAEWEAFLCCWPELAHGEVKDARREQAEADPIVVNGTDRTADKPDAMWDGIMTMHIAMRRFIVETAPIMQRQGYLVTASLIMAYMADISAVMSETRKVNGFGPMVPLPLDGAAGFIAATVQGDRDARGF